MALRTRILFVIAEAVAGIVGRADVAACLFFIGSLLCYIVACPVSNRRYDVTTEPSKTKWKWLFACIVFSAASMLTKEQGITVLGICAVYELVFISGININSFKESLNKVRK